ncbi:MAG: MOSC domain-containing protein [Saprospiraceae bacterium]
MKDISAIRSIIIRPQRRTLPVRVQEAKIIDTGIEGDHYAKADGNRQVTLIAKDQLDEMAATVGFQGDAHLECRRNIMVDTLPKENLKGKKIALGRDVILEITGYCTPCSRMEENFGEGAIDAFSERAGWTAKVISHGAIYVGDLIKLL